MRPVYFIRAGFSGPVKIGKAEDVQARISVLQTAHYEQLRLVRTIAGGLAEEISLHRQFEHLHIRGEWFHWDENMLAADPSDQRRAVGDMRPKLARACDHKCLVDEIEIYLRKRGISETTFGRLIGSDGRFVSRLRSGRPILTHTEERVREFLEIPYKSRAKRPTKEVAHV